MTAWRVWEQVDNDRALWRNGMARPGRAVHLPARYGHSAIGLPASVRFSGS
jgi:hypothetical protein